MIHTVSPSIAYLVPLDGITLRKLVQVLQQLVIPPCSHTLTCLGICDNLVIPKYFISYYDYFHMPYLNSIAVRQYGIVATIQAMIGLIGMCVLYHPDSMVLCACWIRSV